MIIVAVGRAVSLAMAEESASKRRADMSFTGGEWGM
jgi:hypothetical protein